MLPVPTNNAVYFKSLLEGHTNIQIDIFNTLGKKVTCVSFSSTDLLKVGLNKQPQGMYFFTIRNENEILQKGKLIKK